MKLNIKSIEETIVQIPILNWITGLNLIDYPLGVLQPIFSVSNVLTSIFIYLIVPFVDFSRFKIKFYLLPKKSFHFD